MNQPTMITFASGRSVVSDYDWQGVKYRTRQLDSSGRTVATRRYVGNLVIDDGKVVMHRFAGGYFGSDGEARYHVTDYQGNVTDVVTASGIIEQTTGYYPDGEPWQEPDGTNSYTFGGKERLALGATQLYDFGARLYSSPAAAWLQMDSRCEDYYPVSPYSYCAGNPVMFADPTGCNVCIIVPDGLVGHIAMLIQDENDKWAYYSINGENKWSGNGANAIGIVGDWESPQEFLESEFNQNIEDETHARYVYTEGYEIETSKQQDLNMIEEFTRVANGAPYCLFSNNCATTVERALIKGNIPFNNRISVYNQDYQRNEISRYSIMTSGFILPYPLYNAVKDKNKGTEYIRTK